MKTYALFLLIPMLISCSSDGKKTGREALREHPSIIDTRSSVEYLIDDMKECGRGYVVGVWSKANDWNEWAVWLSPKGRHSSKDAKMYWAYSKLETNYDSGKNAYATILAAQASGQVVTLFDDEVGSQCNTWGSGEYNGPQFNSVKAMFPAE
ncbi:hypothetical protein [Xenorhabdus miraniensis]|uniref:Lipoprotein n=1 Tax=Xenorhabdus miraniensis TaxID=351674 RepID=A0A2D0JMP9_9GAMM|nr:hypothetical protein [Xenorhabdus miraniensis]PHM47580.1 hypothetical protein Xmir_03135 [Xenorhabdus miraniensis]